MLWSWSIYKTNKRSVLSLHLKQVTNVGSDFKVSARAKDNIIESLEYKDKSHFILGVQYHPELDDDKIFKYLSDLDKTEQCRFYLLECKETEQSVYGSYKTKYEGCYSFFI